MKESKGDRKFLWVYAVILFTSAFVVLLITAYSQIKFTKNIENYKMKLDEHENLKVGFEFHLQNAADEIKKLKEALSASQAQVEKAKSELEKSVNEKENGDNQTSKKLKAYEQLLIADELFENNNFVDCALLLKDMDPGVFEDVGARRYQDLVEKTFPIAAEELYYQGFKCFSRKDYEEAIALFDKSKKLQVHDYFSDDSVFLTGVSYYNMGNFQQAEKFFRELIADHPKSSYNNEASRLLEIIENG